LGWEAAPIALQREGGKEENGRAGSQAWNRAWGRETVVMTGEQWMVLRRAMRERMFVWSVQYFEVPAVLFCIIGIKCKKLTRYLAISLTISAFFFKDFLLEDWNILVGQQREGASREHTAGEVTHDRFGLDVEIAQHFVTVPAAE
jgi:hypothetical protein